jgi:ribosomal protein L40E
MTDGKSTTAFKGLKMDKMKIIQIVGLVATFVLCIAMLVIGLAGICGFFLVGIILYLIPHYTGTKDVRVLTVYGIVFMLVALAVGTFAVSMPMVNGNSTPHDGELMKDVDVTYDNGQFTFTAVTDLAASDRYAQVHYDVITMITYNNTYTETARGITSDMDRVDDPIANKTTWTKTVDAREGELYIFFLNMVDRTAKDDGTLTDVVVEKSKTMGSFITFATDNGHIQSVCLKGNAYYISLMLVIFLIVLYATFLIRRVAENTRVKMEAEGRLYPKGYGTCKKCGAVVLPGETSCRKCGAYIDVPEELKVHKSDCFECSDCGASVPADAIVCPKCGAKFDDDENPPHSPYTECPECGADVPEGMDSCPRCGKKFE